MKKKLIPTKDRKKEEITLVLFSDIVEDLKRISVSRYEFENYKTLIRHYIGQGLREDKHKEWEEQNGEK